MPIIPIIYYLSLLYDVIFNLYITIKESNL